MTPGEFLDGLAEPRCTEVAQLNAVIRAAVPDLERVKRAADLDPGDLTELLRKAAAARAAKI